MHVKLIINVVTSNKKQLGVNVNETSSMDYTIKIFPESSIIRSFARTSSKINEKTSAIEVVNRIHDTDKIAPSISSDAGSSGTFKAKISHSDPSNIQQIAASSGLTTPDETIEATFQEGLNFIKINRLVGKNNRDKRLEIFTKIVFSRTDILRDSPMDDLQKTCGEQYRIPYLNYEIRDIEKKFGFKFTDLPNLLFNASLNKRIKYADKCLTENPDALITNITRLFTEEEITSNEVVNYQFFGLLKNRISNKTKKHYSFIKMYLENFKEKFENDGHIWKYLGEIKPGINLCRIKNEYTGYDPQLCPGELNHQIHPAVEPFYQSLHDFVLPNQGEPLNLTKLGFQVFDSLNGRFLTYPTPETLMARWKEFQKINPLLPQLSIVLCDGIASSEEFIKVYLDGHIIVSAGIEQMHDVLVHLLPTLLAILENPEQFKILDTESKKFVQDIMEAINNKKSKALNKAAHLGVPLAAKTSPDIPQIQPIASNEELESQGILLRNELKLLEIAEYYVGMFIDIHTSEDIVIRREQILKNWKWENTPSKYFSDDLWFRAILKGTNYASESEFPAREFLRYWSELLKSIDTTSTASTSTAS